MKKSGNTVLITGGSSGIGLALAEKFLKEGNEVIICGRTKSTLDDVKKVFPDLNTIAADVSTKEGREIIFNEIENRFPSLNLLINNAGIYKLKDIEESDYISNLENEIATNLVAPIALIQQLLPILKRRKQSSIVNVTTGYVFIPTAHATSYSATKSGLRTITQGLRFKLRNSSINVVEVIPPVVDTQMNQGKDISKMTSEDFAQKVFSGLVNGHSEIAVGVSKVAKILSRLAPKFSFYKLNIDEEKQLKK